MVNFSLNKLQSIFLNSINNELIHDSNFTKDENINVLLLHEANMLLILTNKNMDKNEVEVALYLDELESEINRLILNGSPKEWYSKLIGLIQHYRKRWIEGEYC